MRKEEFLDRIDGIMCGTSNAERAYLEDLYDEVTKPHWISVDEELPPLEQEVLICEQDGILGCNTFLVDARQKDYYNNSNTNNGWEWRSELDPTHWMPLPEAPEGGEQ